MGTIGEKCEDEECRNDEDNNEDDDKEVISRQVRKRSRRTRGLMKRRPMVLMQVMKRRGTMKLRTNQAAKCQATESVKGESSELDVSEDGVTDKVTSEDEESVAKESDRENPITSQDSITLSGLCPPETEGGDFLYGCSVPVVLRETPDRTQMILIGEAYVYGKVDGEAMEDFPDRTVETFYIR
jgi:hypothetical protein